MRRPKCPYSVVGLCRTCWTQNKQMARKDGEKDECTQGHRWNMIVLRGDVIIREVPKDRAIAKSAKLCEHRQQDGVCTVGCPHAHNAMESEIWIWQLENKVQTSEALVAASERYYSRSDRAMSLPGEAFSAAIGLYNARDERAGSVPPMTGRRSNSIEDMMRKAGLEDTDAGGEWTTVGRRSSVQIPIIKGRLGSDRSPSPGPSHWARNAHTPRNQQRSQFQQLPNIMAMRKLPAPSKPGVQGTPAKKTGASGKGQPKTPGHGNMTKPKQSHGLRVPSQGPANGPNAASDFPLSNTHSCVIGCSKCLKKAPKHSYYELTKKRHSCDEDILAVCENGSKLWQQVRARVGQHNFRGHYQLCRNFSQGNRCNLSERRCTFAHSPIEQTLWNMEKDGQFNIMDFIKKNRSASANQSYSLHLLKEHGGVMVFLCWKCFHCKPTRISREGEDGLCEQGHPWADNRMMMHAKNDSITPIRDRPFRHRDAYFNLCYNLRYCQNEHCIHAHSDVEQAVWVVENEMHMTREQIQAEMGKNGAGNVESVTYLPKEGRSTTPSRTPWKQPLPTQEPEPQLVQCPYRVVGVCSLCRRNLGGRYVHKLPSADKCQNGHPWKANRIGICYEGQSSNVIRDMPERIPRAFVLCQHMRSCFQYPKCTFAHCEVEREVWTWQVENKVKTLDDLIDICARTAAARADQPPPVTRPVPQKTSTANATKQAPPKDQVSLINPYYCKFCARTCNGQSQWDEHCTTSDHVFNVNSDKDRQWNYRQPPWGIKREYELCRCTKGDYCRYKDTDDAHNACMRAHNQEELDEWNERRNWRKMKVEMAREEGMFSYMDDLLEEYEQAQQGLAVLADTVQHVTVDHEALSKYTDSKVKTFTWTFNIIAKKGVELKKVALLDKKDRLHFLIMGGESTSQLRPGEDFHVGTSKKKDSQKYEVKVQFRSDMFGSFRQRVVFDFGSRPVLTRSIAVDVGTKESQQELEELREKLKFDRWTSDNKEIVRIKEFVDPFDESVLRKYKAPRSIDDVVTRNTVMTELNSSNYVHKMHQYLYLEEITQHKIISSFNMNTKADLLDTIENNCYVKAYPGELFARIKPEDELTDDSDAGQLILAKVRKILLAKHESSKRVYEVKFVEKEVYDFDGRGRDYIYLRLHQECCKGLQLSPGSTVNIALQFQMDRTPFARMHYALDQLKKTDLLFPDVAKIARGLKEERKLELSSSLLNDSQMKIIEHIAMHRKDYSPPLIVYGPFGTGKTMTLALATRILVEPKNKMDAKVLICTQSNSAADWYITQHLGDLSEKGIGMKKLTALAKRPSNVASEEVLKHCFLSEDRTRFVEPTLTDLANQRIIITTFANSLLLNRLGMQGNFTHIFLDEAGQALECEVIIPLLLADNATTVVLAGDHIQIAPKVYSQEAKRQGFHKTLLERLFKFYVKNENLTPMLATPLNTLLSINYRSSHEIVRYLSKAFYKGRLDSGGTIPICENVQSLMFMTVQGEEVQDEGGTSYFNVSEANEVTEAIRQLLEFWPPEWGEKRASSVAVVTPYQDQVKLIRKNLRQHRLKDVVVERVQNIQGREFRAMFISTVRTYHICDNPPQTTSDISDLGFLTDRKLLNTAMTRAQFLVAVVGDPIALCSIGDCVTAWRLFIHDCDQLGSIHPSHLNLRLIREAVENFEAEPTIGRNLGMVNERLAMKKVIPPSRNAQCDEEDNRVETDEILKQLTREIVRSLRQTQPPDLNIDLPSRDEDIKPECIKVKQTATTALLTYRPKKTQKRRLLGAADADREYDSEEGEEEGAEVLSNVAELRALLRSDAKKYKECIFHFDRRSMYADIIDKEQFEGQQFRIIMSSRIRCGQAFNNDTVVVEILKAPDDDIAASPDQEKQMLGQVCGVLKRAVDPRYKIFVCNVVDPNHTGLMAPIDRGIPRIMNLSLQHAHPHKKGHVNVYKFSVDHDINFDRYEPIDEFKPKSKLFKVRYLKWDPGHPHPLGIVVDILEEGNTIERGLEIVNAEHRVHQSYNRDVLEEVDGQYPAGYDIPADTTSGRTDIRELMVFAIDPEGCQDVDDCLSFEVEDDTDANTKTYVVGVHIADVSHFIERGSAVDEEAKKRGTSLYPPGSDVVHMLPLRLSTDILSLHEGHDRLALSVFISVDKDGKVTNIEPKRTTIKSKFQLSYQQAEVILHEDTTEYRKELKQRVWGLYNVAQQWRRERLGTAAMFQQLDEEDKDSAYAHLLVSEIMIKANQSVASYLFEKYPDCTPLRRQMAPNELELDEWRERHALNALNSLVLRRPFIPNGWTCECDGLCDCVSASLDSACLEKLDCKFFDIKSEVWEKLLEGMKRADVEMVRKVILDPEHHPHLWVAQRQFRKILNMADYVCSDTDHEDINWHYSENMQTYTHFTSPIRRYVDIVVHRLLTAAMQGQPCPYGPEEMEEICNASTAASRRSRNYEHQLLGLHMGSALQTKPLVAFPVVDETDDHSIHFAFPDHIKLYGIQNTVNLTQLGVAGRPSFEEQDSRLVARWQQRIYNLGHEVAPRDPKKSKPGKIDEELVRLNPNRFVKQIPMDTWQNILQALQTNDLGQLAANVTKAMKQVRDLRADKRFVPEVTSEMKDKHKIVQHHCYFEQTIEPGHVKQVQLAMGMFQGLMVPRIQLINLSPNLSICIEHLSETQDCFARLATKKASRETYNCVETYQRVWLPVLEMEAATGAVRNDENFRIRNVRIQWTASTTAEESDTDESGESSESDDERSSPSRNSTPEPDTKAFKGVFDLKESFCAARHIRLSTQGGPAAADTEMSFDYMCIQCAGIRADTSEADRDCVVKIDGDEPVTWVGHCLMTKVENIEVKALPGKGKEDNIVRVNMKVHQSSMPFPRQLLRDSTLPCTVEFIPKSLPSRRMETAVRELSSANSLARNIALNKDPGDFEHADSDAITEICRSMNIPALKPPNTEQTKAIRAALTQKFTLIQGPPGTGKTLTGAQIAYQFSRVNSKLGDMSGRKKKAEVAQVLYCGPSNKSVDVVAGYLKRLKGLCPNIVRVYSELIEHKDFPLPGEPIPWRRRTESYENSVTRDHRNIALHHMIRQNNSDEAKQILEFDKRFKEKPEKVTHKEIDEYKKLVTTCKVDVLKKATIIICTCTASASNVMRMTRGGPEPACSVNQVIIDECGMCQEPESMIPIVATDPCQVVLIGDHKQLRPIILNDTAKTLGLEVSLFERYCRDAIMLEVQYRMHDAIAEFPSKHFYDGRLKPGLPVQQQPSQLRNVWPGPSGKEEPIVFLHVMGHEEVLTVTSAEGNEQSRKNELEAERALKLAMDLVHNHRVRQDQIVILSQYRAQCAEIERKLHDHYLTSIAVSTVVASQGSEWDYVLLSTVRSLPKSEIETKPTRGWRLKKLGFITDQNQINVALTRARKGLIIIGNKHLLKCDNMWDELLKHYEWKKKVVDVRLPSQRAWKKK